MECPKCGYAMTAFDVDCPRCARMAPTTTAEKPASAPVPSSATTPPPHPPESAGQPQQPPPTPANARPTSPWASLLSGMGCLGIVIVALIIWGANRPKAEANACEDLPEPPASFIRCRDASAEGARLLIRE